MRIQDEWLIVKQWEYFFAAHDRNVVFISDSIQIIDHVAKGPGNMKVV